MNKRHQPLNAPWAVDVQLLDSVIRMPSTGLGSLIPLLYIFTHIRQICGKWKTTYISSTTFVCVRAHPAENAIVAEGISTTRGLIVRNAPTPSFDIDSVSFVATHAHPVVATIAGGLSREAFAVLYYAGFDDTDRVCASGFEGFSVDGFGGQR
jgi:hypothetical protein